jgi:hypothetical protein
MCEAHKTRLDIWLGVPVVARIVFVYHPNEKTWRCCILSHDPEESHGFIAQMCMVTRNIDRKTAGMLI